MVENEDPGVFINGANTIDIASNSSKEYKINFYCLKPLVIKLTIFYRNAETNEYISYKINLNVSPADLQGRLELSSVVRETTMKLVTLENPLSKPVLLSKEMITCDNENISIHPNSFTIPEKAEFGMEVLYRPLIVGEITSKLVVKSVDLGESVYTLQLIGLPSNSQK